MAQCNEQIRFLRCQSRHPPSGWRGGAVAFTLIIMVCASAFIALAISSVSTENTSDFAILNESYIWRIVHFSLWQALASSLCAILFALPVARAFARQPGFFGRSTILKLFALPLALPTLVIVLAVLAVWGQAGWLNIIFIALGFEPVLNIYGLSGILLAHVLFNMPLAVRLLLAHLERVPGENWRLAAQLGMTSGAIFRHIEWPVLRAALPGITWLVFMLCLASFTIVLTLGGGPGATTMEVAIYQALRFDFDPGRAVILALLQLVLTVVLLVLASRAIIPLTEMPILGRFIERRDGVGLKPRIFDFLMLSLATIFLVLPLIALTLAGLKSDLIKLLSENIFWQAALTSLLIASGATFLAIILSYLLTKGSLSLHSDVTWQYRVLGRMFTAASGLVLVMPPIVLGAGWFVLLHRFDGVPALVPILVLVINALMAIPFVSRILSPALATSTARHNRLALSLGITGWTKLRLIEFPVLAKPLAMAVAFAMALSLGDLGAIALFGSENFTTLPYLLLQRMGSYRTHDAAGLALLLALLCLGLVFIAEHLRHDRPNNRS